MLARHCWLRLRVSGSRAVNSHISPKEGEIWGTLVRCITNIPKSNDKRLYRWTTANGNALALINHDHGTVVMCNPRSYFEIKSDVNHVPQDRTEWTHLSTTPATASPPQAKPCAAPTVSRPASRVWTTYLAEDCPKATYILLRATQGPVRPPWV